MTLYVLDYSRGLPIMLHQQEHNLLCPSERFLLSSDLHSKAVSIFHSLDREGFLENTNVILAGDMSGTDDDQDKEDKENKDQKENKENKDKKKKKNKKGRDGDAMPLYHFILQKAKRLYFVQGNHDLLHPEQDKLRNHDGTFCCLHDRVIATPFGKIGGINGIIGKPDPIRHTYSKQEYKKFLCKMRSCRPDILVTHEPNTERIAKYQLYGHIHQPVLDMSDGNINLDGRVVFFDQTKQ